MAEEFEITPGDIKGAALTLEAYLVSTHKMPKDKASKKALEIVKQAHAANPDFTTEEVLGLVNKDLKVVISEEKTKAKPADKNNALTAAEMAVAKDESLSKNQRIAKLLVMTKESNGGKEKITAIGAAMDLGYQRVKNVKKSLIKKGDIQPDEEDASKAKK